MEEWGPVDVFCEFAEGLVFDGAGAGEFWLGWGVVVPVDFDFVLSGFFEGDGWFGFLIEGLAEFGVAFFVFRYVCFFVFV